MMIYKTEEATFNALKAIVKKFNMADLFNQQLPKLKLFFYQIDKLLAITNADLSRNFMEE